MLKLDETLGPLNGCQKKSFFGRMTFKKLGIEVVIKVISTVLALTAFIDGCKTLDSDSSDVKVSAIEMPKTTSVNVNNVTVEMCKREIPPLKIDLSSHAFSGSKAMLLSALAEATYRQKGRENRKILAEWGFDAFYDFRDPKTGADMLIAASDDLILIGFTGSDEITDWLRDCKVQPGTSVNFAGTQHSGIEEGFRALRNFIKSKTTELLEAKIRPIMISGHSLGGAYALLAGEYLVERGLSPEYKGPKIDVNAVYTFGQIRVGDEEFGKTVTKNLREEYVRIYNGFDPVAHMFPRSKASIEEMRLISPTFFKINGWHLDLSSAAYTHPESYLLVLRDESPKLTFIDMKTEAEEDSIYWGNAVTLTKKNPSGAAKIIQDHRNGGYVCSTLRYFNKHRED